MGAGGLILGMRSQLDEHTSAECVAVTGSNQSAATASVSRALSEHSSGTLTYSLTQRGIGPRGWRAEGVREVLERALDVERRPGGGDDDGDAESEGEARVEV